MSEESEQQDRIESGKITVSTELRFSFPTNESLEIFFSSFEPEMHSIPSKRTRFTMKKEFGVKPAVVFHIECDDLIAFRATVNHFIVFASIIEKTLAITESKK
jgi:tRNA threonylcarbamoyladenosine modification (KEOPS) complex  Pcc1 subunit